MKELDLTEAKFLRKILCITRRDWEINMKDTKMYEMLSLMTYLVKLKYGNSDKGIYEKVLEAEKLLAEAGGEDG